MAAVAQFPDIHTRSFADMFHPIQGFYVLVVVG